MQIKNIGTVVSKKWKKNIKNLVPRVFFDHAKHEKFTNRTENGTNLTKPTNR